MRRLLPSPAEKVDLEAEYCVADAVPWHLRVSFVSSADGAMTVNGRAGELGNDGDRRVFGLLRDLSDVILVGAGTARIERYRAQRPTGERLDRRRRHGLPDAPIMALVSKRLDFDLDGGLFDPRAPRSIVITSDSSPADRRSALERVADVLVVGGESVDLSAAVAALRDRGFRRAHCEGGPHLFATALKAGIVDELCLTLSPMLTGPGAGRIVAGPELPIRAEMSLRHVLEEDGYLFLRYDLRQEPAAS
ncbi:MAG: pyrimidine reductase family protein [Geodermatophilaceae bacterium]|jgi:riboflavin biosynthesis pyrimidine reductase